MCGTTERALAGAGLGSLPKVVLAMVAHFLDHIMPRRSTGPSSGGHCIRPRGKNLALRTEVIDPGGNTAVVAWPTQVTAPEKGPRSCAASPHDETRTT